MLLELWELLLGVMSIGSPEEGEGAEVLMVGVGVGVVIIGTVREVILLSSRSPPTALRAALSMEAI